MTRIIAVIATLLAVEIAAGQSQIVYTLELGGDNHADLWEANLAPAFTRGVTSGVPSICPPEDLTWAVRVSVGGTHVDPGGPGHGLVPCGAANLVFDLELYDSQGQLVPGFGAAPLVAQDNQNLPVGMGFWSSINDGDTGGSRGAFAEDLLANAAFAIGIHNQGETDPPQLYALPDPAPNGPNFDYGWYPAANGRGGIDIAGTKPISTAVTGLDGKLVGFGAGYKSYDYTSYRPGVGMLYVGSGPSDFGFGATVDRIYAPDPLAPGVAEAERVVFEGQICTKGMPWGTYTLKVKPTPGANNVLHGAVNWNSATPDYGTFGSFATAANEVYPNDQAGNPGMQFEVLGPPPPPLIYRRIFYNQSYYDGNKVAIDPAPLAGANNDDADAIDPSKSPLMPGAGMANFANWTGYDKGINGLIYDVGNWFRTPVPADFTFLDIGKAGTLAGTPKAPSGFRVIPGAGADGTDRVVITFANGSIKNTWLKVTIGTGFGLIVPDVHYWGNAVGECGTIQTTNILVDATDEVQARFYPRTPFNRAPVNYAWDYNKNSLCDATDQLIARNNRTTPFTCLKVITR